MKTLGGILKWILISILIVAVIDALFVHAFQVHGTKELVMALIKWVLENTFLMIGAVFETIFGNSFAQHIDLGPVVGFFLIAYVIYALFHKK